MSRTPIAPSPPVRPRRGLRSSRAVASWIALLAAAACSPDRGPGELIDPSGSDSLVLDAILIVDQEFPRIYLSRTAAPLAPFSFGAVAESDASIEIWSNDRTIVVYEEVAVAGTYEPRFGPAPRIVQPETKYEIQVVTADGRRVTGSTVTPPRFHVDDWLLLENDARTIRGGFQTFETSPDSVFEVNTVRYADGLLEARFVRPDVPAFQVAVRNLEEASPLLVVPDFLSDEDLASLERSLSSPALLGEDSTLRLPWLAIYYEGRTIIRIHAIDRNWFDLIRSTPGLDGGSGAFAFGGNLGEGFEAPIFHLSGGIGLFGSGSVDSIGFRVLAPY